MSLTKKYDSVHKLLEVDSISDPEEDPYKSKYAARDILQDMKNIITCQIDREISDQENSLGDGSVLKAQLSAILVHLGIIGLETEELSTGQEFLDRSAELMSEMLTSPLFVHTAVLCHNHLAVLWSQRDEQEKAHSHLVLSKQIYLQYRSQAEARAPKALFEIFHCELKGLAEGWKALEKQHTLTLYYLAQVLGKLGKANESAQLCLQTLHRQLNCDDFQVITWAINAATLAKFYQINAKFRLARRLLSAAMTILNTHMSGMEAEMQNQDSVEKFIEAKAEVSERFASYCVSLLQSSSDSFDSEIGESSNEESNSNDGSQFVNCTEQECLDKMEFCQLELTAVEESVSYKIAKSYDDARLLFMSGLRWLTDARNYYTLEEHASKHTEITREMSTLYKLLSSFDGCPSRRSKMHKRRVDLLTPVLDKLSCTFYLQVCRQLDYELGETYSTMVDCKYEIGDPRDVNLDQHHLDKINSLANFGILHFNNYLKSFVPTGDDEAPKNYPVESSRPILVAFFHLGRLWSKLVGGHLEERISYIVQALRNYEFLVLYCEEHPDCKPVMADELPACQEMVRLLPFKIQRMRETA